MQAIKTLDTLLAHAELVNANTAAGLSVVGTEVDVDGSFGGDVYVFHAIVETTGNDPGIEYHIQVRHSTADPGDDDGDENWQTVLIFTSTVAAGVLADISGAEAQGQTTIDVDADPSGDFGAGDRFYIEDTGTVDQGEWGRCAHVDINTITTVDGLSLAKDAADRFWTQAQTFHSYISLEGVSKIRAIIVGQDGAGGNIHYKAFLRHFSATQSVNA